MARSKEMQDALDIVAGRKSTPPEHTGRSALERVGLMLWAGVGIMILGIGALYALS